MGPPKKTEYCGACNKNIPKSVFRIQCDACKRWHHATCAKLTELEIRVMGQQNRAWSCNKCRRKSQISRSDSETSDIAPESAQGRRPTLGGEQRDSDLLRSLILELKTEIKGLKGDVTDIKESLEFLNAIYEEQKQTNKVMGDMIDEVKKENAKLRADMINLQNKMSELETDKNGKCLVINGAYENGDADIVLKNKTTALLKYVNDEFTENCIEDFRIIKPKNKPPLVNVSLKQRSLVTSMLKKRKEKGNLDTVMCGLGTSKQRIYINEHLNKDTYMLLKQSMQCKQKGFKYVWSSNGSVYLRKSDNDQAIKIISSDQLKDILSTHA